MPFYQDWFDKMPDEPKPGIWLVMTIHEQPVAFETEPDMRAYLEVAKGGDESWLTGYCTFWKPGDPTPEQEAE